MAGTVLAGAEVWVRQGHEASIIDTHSTFQTEIHLLFIAVCALACLGAT
jgi:hypothetical protein